MTAHLETNDKPAPATAARARRARVHPLVFAVLLAQVLIPLVILQQPNLGRGEFATASDAARFHEIATTPGTPYRDFAVEYPPVAVAVFHALGGRDVGSFVRHLVVLNMCCQALIVGLLFRVWGRRACVSYLCLSAPMLFIVYPTYDLVAIALGVAGAALIRRRHPTAGSVALVAGAFTKLWPGALLLLVGPRRQTRAFVIGGAAAVVSSAAWVAWGGPGAIGQVLTFRGSRGWEFESVSASLLRLFTRQPLRFEAGAWRVGAPSPAVTVLAGVVVLAVVAIAWRRMAGGVPPRSGVGETVIVTALVVASTLLSPQFAMWLLPWVAIAAAAGAGSVERWGGAVVGLTALTWLSFEAGHPELGRTELVILGRNAALIGLLVAALLALRAPKSEPALTADIGAG